MIAVGNDASAVTVVCVLGTPRSGTSLTARVLNLCGLYFGEREDMIPASSVNEAGFWELGRAVTLNARILKRLGGTGYSAPLRPPGWEACENLLEEREEARQLIAETFAGRQAWGWKDPRNSFTLPFWQVLVPRMRHVVCFRNPLDSAASGRRMASGQLEMDEPAALELWQRYLLGSILNTRGQPRIFVPYEAYFDDARATVERLTRFAGLEAPDGRTQAQMGKLIDPLLRHHLTPAEKALEPGRLPDDVRSLYEALLDVALARTTSRGQGLVEESEGTLDRLAQDMLTGKPAAARS